MNLLGAVRLSSITEETTSPERQRDQIALTAKARGDELVAVAEDLDISGAVSPFDRPALGPWLADPERSAQWDGLVVAKLDRLTRSLFDFQRLIQWCQDNGKTIVSVAEAFDLATPTGKLMANLLVMFAEFERERIRERRRERAADDKRRGWWGGGARAYGYEPVKVENHWELRPDPAQVAIIERMAHDILAGKAAAAIARNLTAEQVPTQRGGRWTAGVVLGILRDPRSPMDPTLYREVKAALDGSRKNFTNRYDAAYLLNIAFCAACEAPLWGRSITKRRSGKVQVYRYYRCSRFCEAKVSVRQDELDDVVNTRVIESYGWAPRYEKRLLPGTGKQQRLDAIDKQIDGLDKDDPSYPDQWLKLHQERQRVKAEPSEPDRYEHVPTGESVAEYWARLDPPARRQYLLAEGVKVYAGRAEEGWLTVVVEGGDLSDTLDRLQGRR